MEMNDLIVELVDRNVGSLMYDTDQNGDLVLTEDSQEIYHEEYNEIEAILLTYFTKKKPIEEEDNYEKTSM